MFRDRHDIHRFLSTGDDVALVSVEKVQGSAPRDAGAWMLVSRRGTFRTIGGGALEYMAIDKARALLAADGGAEEMDVPLGPDIGQCCGGRVALSIRRLQGVARDALVEECQQEIDALPRVLVFGAGHVGNALAEALSLLPLWPVLIDSRKAELATAPAGIETRLSAIPEAEVRGVPAGSGFVILTHDHSLDFLIAEQVLARGDAGYLGMIGSKTKRATFVRWHERQNGSREGLDRLICPIGRMAGAPADKRPEVIAAFVAAEIMAHIGAEMPVGSKHSATGGDAT